MNEPIQDRVRKGRIWDPSMPLVNGDLGGNESGGVAKAVVEDLENVLGILDGDGIPHPIIENEQTAAGQRTQGGGEGTIGADLAEGMQ